MESLIDAAFPTLCRFSARNASGIVSFPVGFLMIVLSALILISLDKRFKLGDFVFGVAGIFCFAMIFGTALYLGSATAKVHEISCGEL